jgi:hypothetical protein
MSSANGRSLCPRSAGSKGLHEPPAGFDHRRAPPGADRRALASMLKKATYRFICDPHATIMKGVLKVT